jgi:hypothetical protein
MHCGDTSCSGYRSAASSTISLTTSLIATIRKYCVALRSYLGPLIRQLSVPKVMLLKEVTALFRKLYLL